ncbi:MAG: translation initiation factor IF-2 [Planctomycetes bacterium]|nr:translation initiation factor IF-2 [Planctomycetota bacterium]
MKIRIFALAKELDIDSKLLIDYCSKAGITIKNSALASISPEERDRVMDIIRSSGAPAAATSVATAPTVPQREHTVEVVGKARTIRNMNEMMARPQPSRVQVVESHPQPAVVELPAPEPTTTPAAESVVEPPVARDVAANVESPIPEAAVEIAELPPVASVETEPESVQSTLNEPSTPVKPAPPARGEHMQPASIPPRVMRTMTSRSSSDLSGSKGAPLAKKPKTGLNFAAIPKSPVAKAAPKPEEQAAQKPIIKLMPGGEQREAAPLRGHLGTKKGPEKKGRIDDDEEARIKAIKGGSSLEEGRNLRKKKALREEEEENERRRISGIRPKGPRGRHVQKTELKSTAEVDVPITVRSLSEAIGRPAKSIIQILFARGEMATMNSMLGEDEAVEVCLELGVDLQVKRGKTIEEQIEEAVTSDDRPEDLLPRPPIITILGHVDHGKTTLVDKLRSANVAASEFGGITQHIAAYQIDHNGHKLTFVDTPGHAAFGEMRARGANVTDIVVLVVAANDGVMPQTVECISHAKAAGVPIVVAMNKVDLPDRNEQRVLTDLSTHNVLASEWGGDVEVVRTSGLTGEGLPELLDTLLLTAELHDFRANANRPASGACLEAFRDEGRGPLAWLIVRKGTLRVGDVVLCGASHGRIRAMYNEWDQEVQEAGPSTPIKVAGLDLVPSAGDQFLVLDDLEAARTAAAERHQKGRTAVLANMGGRRTMEDILNAARDGQVQDLTVIVKADTPGSLEALRSELGKFEHPEVRVKLLHEGVGGVNESDVYLAAASNAVIFAFHVIAEDRAQQLAQQESVEIRRYNIIYEVMDEIKRILEGMLRPEQKEVTTGRAIVLRTFSITRFGTIAGCRVLNGTIERNSRVHLIRDQKVMNTYSIASLKREKDDAKEVREGMECGIRLDHFNDIKEGDLLEAYKIEEVKRTLE